MFIVQGMRPAQKREWICGVSAQRDAAEAFRASIPSTAHERFILRESEVAAYPLFIIQTIKPNGMPQPSYDFTDAKGVVVALRGIMPGVVRAPLDSSGQARPCFIVFVVTEDWQPKDAPPGQSRMGELDHVHVNGRTFIELDGFSAWLTGFDASARGPLEELAAQIAEMRSATV